MAVHAGPGEDEFEVLDRLAQLVEKSLVQVEEQGNERRYVMLETVRQYGLGRLDEAGERKVLSDRHLAYYAHLAGTVTSAFSGSGAAQWVQRLEIEHDNMRSALEWSKGQDGDTDTGMRLASLLLGFWETRGYLGEGRGHLEALLSRDRGPRSRRIRGVALHTLWHICAESGELSKAGPLVEESLEIFRAQDDKVGIAASLINVGNVVYASRRDREKAKALFEESLAIFTAMDNKVGIAVSLSSLGSLSAGLLNVAVCRVLPDKSDFECTVIVRLGAREEQHDYEAARLRFEESLAIYREIKDKRGIASLLIRLAALSISQGDLPMAREYARESLRLFGELERTGDMACALSILGTIAYMGGDGATARSHYEECLEIGRNLGDKPGVASALDHLGDLMISQGDFGSAREALNECRALRQELGIKGQIAYTTYKIGNLLTAEGKIAAARAAYLESLSLWRQAGDEPAVITFLEGAAGLAVRVRKFTGAVMLLGAAQTAREELGRPSGLFERRRHDTLIRATRDALGEEAHAAAWNRGAGMTLDEAVAYARSEFLDGGDRP